MNLEKIIFPFALTLASFAAALDSKAETPTTRPSAIFNIDLDRISPNYDSEFPEISVLTEEDILNVYREGLKKGFEEGAKAGHDLALRKYFGMSLVGTAMVVLMTYLSRRARKSG